MQNKKQRGNSIVSGSSVLDKADFKEWKEIHASVMFLRVSPHQYIYLSRHCCAVQYVSTKQTNPCPWGDTLPTIETGRRCITNDQFCNNLNHFLLLLRHWICFIFSYILYIACGTLYIVDYMCCVCVYI